MTATLEVWSEAGAQMWVPLIQQGELEGVLGGKVAGEFFTREDRFILFTMAHQVSTAIARTRLVDQLEGRIHEVQALARQLMALQERNQQRIAQEIRDATLQDLFFVRRLLEGCLLGNAPEKIAGARDELLRIAGYLRTLIFERIPPDLPQSNLYELLEQYAAAYQKKRGLEVFLQANGGDNAVTVPHEVKLVLYRIFQECLNNARKHARISCVEATLEVKPDVAHLEVWDQGVGFDVPAHLGGQIDAGQHGLVLMRERAVGGCG